MVWQAARVRVQVRLVAATGIVLLLFAAALAGPVSAQDDSGPVTVTVNEVDGTNVSGNAILTPYGAQTTVDMTLEGAGIAGNHPTHIHTGTCSNFDPNPLFPLETVVLQSLDQSGKSVSTVDVSVAELQSGDYVILVHKSPEELTTYLSCGEIPRLDGAAAGTTAQPAAATGGDHTAHAGAAPTPQPGVTTMPISGAGDLVDQGDQAALALSLGVMAGMIFTAALIARRRTLN